MTITSEMLLPHYSGVRYEQLRDMDRGPLNYYGQGIIKCRICVENVPEDEQMRIIK